MASRLVDTNIVSYLVKNDSRADLYRLHLDQQRLYVSFMTVAELYKWALQHRWGERRTADLRRDLRHYVVLASDDALAWQWAKLATIRGHPMNPSDAWIAATALRHNLPLVTHNRRHFEHLPGLHVISEAP